MVQSHPAAPNMAWERLRRMEMGLDGERSARARPGVSRRAPAEEWDQELEKLRQQAPPRRAPAPRSWLHCPQCNKPFSPASYAIHVARCSSWADPEYDDDEKTFVPRGARPGWNSSVDPNEPDEVPIPRRASSPEDESWWREFMADLKTKAAQAEAEATSTSERRRKRREDEKRAREEDERQRRRAAEAERRAAESVRMRKRAEADARRVAEQYETQWARLDALDASAAVRLAMVPELTASSVRRLDFDKTRLRAAMLRYHPDKFTQRFGSRLEAGEREAILERVTSSFRNVADVKDAINAEARAPG